MTCVIVSQMIASLPMSFLTDYHNINENYQCVCAYFFFISQCYFIVIYALKLAFSVQLSNANLASIVSDYV